VHGCDVAEGAVGLEEDGRTAKPADGIAGVLAVGGFEVNEDGGKAFEAVGLVAAAILQRIAHQQ
jgi:hypothetical protein